MKRSSTDVSAAILAGGMSKRMGTDKALLAIHGKPFIQRIAETLQQVFTTVFIVADRRESYAFVGLPVHEDIIKNSGPLAGIHSALSHVTTPSVFILSCDLPLVTVEAIEHLLTLETSADAIIYSVNSTLQPLCGIYKKSCLAVFEEELKQEKRPVLDALRKVRTLVVDAELAGLQNEVRIFAHINTTEEYQRILKPQD